eukprot:887821-Rhodomonas_salina.2
MREARDTMPSSGLETHIVGGVGWWGSSDGGVRLGIEALGWRVEGGNLRSRCARQRHDGIAAAHKEEGVRPSSTRKKA